MKTNWSFFSSLCLNEYIWRKGLNFGKYKSYYSLQFQKNVKVAVLGAAGGIGQPLSLLLKMSPGVSKLALFDVANSPGVAADLSHISSKAQVKGYLGPEHLKESLKDSKVVLIPAGVPRKPGSKFWSQFTFSTTPFPRKLVTTDAWAS